MKKETIIAIIFGIGLGTILAFFVINRNNETKLTKNKVIAPSGIVNKTITTPVNTQIQAFEITSPQDGVIVDKASILIAGKAEKNSLIIIQSPIKDLSLKNTQTNFSTDFPLALGENTINISVYSSDKNTVPQEKTLKIYYLDSQL